MVFLEHSILIIPKRALGPACDPPGEDKRPLTLAGHGNRRGPRRGPPLQTPHLRLEQAPVRGWGGGGPNGPVEGGGGVFNKWDV